MTVTLVLPEITRAQTPALDSNNDLLQPWLSGNPRKPPRFRRRGQLPAEQPPGVTTLPAPSRIGATPIYGSPTGFGAGNTGFDSRNTPRSKRKARTAASGLAGANQAETTFAPVPSFAAPPPPKPAPPKPPPAPDIYPAKAASRPGAALPPPSEEEPISNPPSEVHPAPAARRPGAVLPIPAAWLFEGLASTPPPGAPPPNTLPLGTVPHPTLPIAAGDPYAALGIRAGSFLLFPAVELSTGYATNPERAPGSGGAPYFIVAPELVAHSDWDRHALDIDIRGSYTQYGENLVPSLNLPYLDSRVDGRIDVSRDTHITTEGRFLLSSDNPGSPNLQAGLAKLPLNEDAGGTLGVIQTFNRLAISLKGAFDRSNYQSSLLTDGELASNADRNFDQYAGVLRVGYELDPGLKPFLEVQQDERIHDEQFDRSGLQRDSSGTSAKVGAAVDLFGSLTGEMGVGYVERVYKDPTLPNIGGFIADGSLIWQATPLTTAKLTAASQVYETIIAGASGSLTRDLSLEVDHALRRWLIAIVKAGYGTDNYVGSALNDTRYFVSGGLAYKLNRDMQIRGEVRQDWLNASEPGFTYMATSVLLGLRLQR